MIKRKTLLGLCVLCALVTSGLAVQSAAAQQPYTCKDAEAKNGDFTDEHCKVAGPKGESTYAHVLITEKTFLEGNNITTGTERSTAKLKSVQAGVTLEIQATEVSGTGEMEPKESGSETWAQGTGTITYSGVTVTAPAGKGCEVVGETVVTNELAGTTKGLTNQLKFTPASGETFAEFEVAGCSKEALNHAYTAKGSVTAKTEGATTTANHVEVTNANTLSLAGQKAGIEGSLTLKVGKEKTTTHPLAQT